jgi:hypothetical protein
LPYVALFCAFGGHWALIILWLEVKEARYAGRRRTNND